MRTLIVYVLLTICELYNSVCAFNVDTKFPIIFEGSPDSYFGFSVGLLRNREGPQALITAPRANSSVLGDQLYQPGVLNSCKVSLANHAVQKCEEVILDKLGNTYIYDQETHTSYHDKKDNMFLGVSLDIQQENGNGRVVTCGHLWKNQFFEKHYLVNGVCYVINNELDPKSVKKLVPLLDQSNQILIPQRIYYYALAQAGTSAVFSEDGKFLLLGAPGFYDWSGTVISYDNPDSDQGNYRNPVIPNPPSDQNLSPESYIGYSLTSGRFFESPEIYIAAGAPRDKNSFGQVYIIKALRSPSDKFQVHMKKGGTQFGEYFGASLLGSDVNNDGFTDLFVGAPFFSLESGDEGKVYAYISNGVGLQLYAEILGRSKMNSRFGSCIASIGDINKDGFNDIAIGAPYEEGSGAVYLYHGTVNGLNIQYSQRIGASDFGKSLSGFGISISKGLDIDNNFYPDILIGSYASSQAVLLRTYPVIHVTPKLEFNPQQINTNITSCDYEGQRVSCINVTTCLLYTGKNTVMNLDFETELHMDFSRQNNGGTMRGHLLYENKKRSVIYRTIKLDILKETCFTYEAYINPDAKDIIFPVDFFFNYKLANASKEGEFCKNCTRIAPTSATNISKSVSFQTGCGKDNRCMADLGVDAHIVGNLKNEPLIIGKNATLTLDIKVKNNGEPAYLSELFIHLPSETPNINQDFCSLLTDQQRQELNASLQCDLGNPLQRDYEVPIQIKIDVSKLSANTESISIFLRARTASDEVNPSDNDKKIQIFFKVVADASITGTAEHEQIQYEDEEDKTVSITHTYFVMNYGPSPIQVLNIQLFIPISLDDKSGSIDFVSFTNIEADSGKPLTIPAKCNDSTIDLKPLELDVKKSKDDIFGEEDLVAKKISNRTLRRVPTEISSSTESYKIYRNTHTQNSHGDTVSSQKRKDFILDCSTARCLAINCMASPFLDSRKVARIEVSLQLKTSLLTEYLGPWYRIEFTTRGKISIPDASNQIHHENHYPDESIVKTIVVHKGPPPSEEIEKWIIFVSIGVGVLLLLIILAVLIKIGFFKRQQKEKMQQMRMQADLKEWEPYLIPEETEAQEEVLNSS